MSLFLMSSFGLFFFYLFLPFESMLFFFSYYIKSLSLIGLFVFIFEYFFLNNSVSIHLGVDIQDLDPDLEPCRGVGF